MSLVINPSLGVGNAEPSKEEISGRCIARRFAQALHPDRVQMMPKSILVQRHFGHPDFQSFSLIALHADNEATSYLSGQMGFAQPQGFTARGHMIGVQFQFHSGHLANPAATLAAAAKQGYSLFDHAQTLPLYVMTEDHYLDAQGLLDELQSAGALHPNQVSFFSGEEKTDEERLRAEFGGELPPFSRADESDIAVGKEHRSHPDFMDLDYKVGKKLTTSTSMLVSGQDFSHRRSLQIETPDLEKKIDPKEYPIKFAVARGAQLSTRPGSFREVFRPTAYYSYADFLIYDSVKNPHHRAHPTEETQKHAEMFAQVNSKKRFDHFTNPDNFGFKFYSNYRGNPEKFAISQPLANFVDLQGIENFSTRLKYLVDASSYDDGGKKGINGREALELLMDARQRATSYLSESGNPEETEGKLEMELRDFSSGLQSQIDLQLQQSARLIPELAHSAAHVAQVLKQTRPIAETRDAIHEYMERISRPYYNPVEGTHVPLVSFLKEQNAVEIAYLGKEKLTPEGAKKILAGAYLDYVNKLKIQGVKNPELFIADHKIQFAMTNHGGNLEAVSEIPKQATWSVWWPEATSTRQVGYFKWTDILVHEYRAESAVITGQTIRAMIDSDPALARSVTQEHPFVRGETHYNQFMTQPELSAP